MGLPGQIPRSLVIVRHQQFFGMIGETEMRSVYQTNTPDAESIWNEGFRDAELIDDDGCASEKFADVRLFDNPRR